MTEPRVSRKTVRLVEKRASFCCEYCWCQEAISPGKFHVEHIVPRTGGGTNLASNLCYACAGCNGAKAAATSGFDSETSREVKLYHPRRDRWFDHFAWSEDHCEVIPLTAIGRATLMKLRLNRPNVIEHRRILRDIGRHPPTVTRPSERKPKD